MPLYLIATIAGQRIALPADRIESVVEIDFITAVPHAAAHVAGLSALRSRVLTVIDSYAALGLGSMPGAAVHQAVAVRVDSHLYALIVDEVEDVTAFESAPCAVGAPLTPGWARVAEGVLEHSAGLVLLVDPAGLVAGTGVAAVA